MSGATTLYKGFFQLDRVALPNGRAEEVLRTSNSVCVLIYDQTLDRFILVRQARASQISETNPTGQITELAAGRFDGAYTVRQLMAKEVREETGIEVSEQDFVLLNGGQPMAVSAGAMTERSYLGYVSVRTDEDLSAESKTYGLASEQESINRVTLKRVQAERYLQGGCEDIRVFALLTWALNHK
ncbi:MAG: NUDIX domain-containing protein [Candidatus Komeilibacteria bacterium]